MNYTKGIMFYGHPDCPVEDCRGDDECCHACGYVKGNMWSKTPLQMTTGKKFKDPTWFVLGVVLYNFLLFMVIFVLNVAKKRVKNPARTKAEIESAENLYEFDEFEYSPACTSPLAKSVVGMILLLMFVSLITTTGYLIVVLTTEFTFYRDCHSTLTILFSWIVLCAFIVIDGFIQFVPSVTKTMEKNQKIKQAILTVDQGLSAKRLIQAEKIKTSYGSSSLCSKIINYPLSLLLIWWVFITVYFIGIGEEKWNPISI